MKTDAETTIKRIHELCQAHAKDMHEKMAALGATVEDEHGPLIPQPQTDREKIMFMAGQQSFALFIQGASS